jgi:hypothetical protein
MDGSDTTDVEHAAGTNSSAYQLGSSLSLNIVGALQGPDDPRAAEFRKRIEALGHSLGIPSFEVPGHSAKQTHRDILAETIALADHLHDRIVRQHKRTRW